MFSTFAGGLKDVRESSELCWGSGVGGFPVGVGDFPSGVSDGFVVGVVVLFSGDTVPFCLARDSVCDLALGRLPGSRLTLATCSDHVMHHTSHMKNHMIRDNTNSIIRKQTYTYTHVYMYDSDKQSLDVQ